MDRRSPAAPVSRVRDGCLAAGVCAGLAARWDRPVGVVRGAFAATSLLAGLGALVYVACWLVLPAEGEDGAPAGSRGIVVLAQACGALLGLGALAAAGALGAVFGFGWVVVAVAASVLVGTLVSWPRLGPGWALLPLGALVLPGLALAAADVDVEPRTAPVTLAPRTLDDLPADGLRSGLGLLTVDLRRTALPATGRIPLRIDAGVRRTLVALPHHRCVQVEVRQRPVPLVLRVARAGLDPRLPGGGAGATPGVQLFGTLDFGTRPADDPARARGRGPTLVVDYRSDGGSLVIRDYPDDVDPTLQPDWPGFPVSPERWQRRIERTLTGPCARKGARR